MRAVGIGGSSGTFGVDGPADTGCAGSGSIRASGTAAASAVAGTMGEGLGITVTGWPSATVVLGGEGSRTSAIACSGVGVDGVGARSGAGAGNGESASDFDGGTDVLAVLTAASGWGARAVGVPATALIAASGPASLTSPMGDVRVAAMASNGAAASVPISGAGAGTAALLAYIEENDIAAGVMPDRPVSWGSSG